MLVLEEVSFSSDGIRLGAEFLLFSGSILSSANAAGTMLQ